LYLDGIDAISIEKVQREVLFQLFINRFNSPSALVDFSKVFDREFKVVGFSICKVTKQAEILQEGFSLIFITRKTFTGQQ